jgi:hypothetical protein
MLSEAIGIPRVRDKKSGDPTVAARSPRNVSAPV